MPTIRPMWSDGNLPRISVALAAAAFVPICPAGKQMTTTLCLPMRPSVYWVVSSLLSYSSSRISVAAVSSTGNAQIHPRVKSSARGRYRFILGRHAHFSHYVEEERESS